MLRRYNPLLHGSPRAWDEDNKLWKGKGGGKAPAAPDYTALAAANKEAAQLGYKAANENLNFQKQIYGQALPYLQQMQQLGLSTAKSDQEMAADNAQRAEEQWLRQIGVFSPLETQMAMQSMGSQYLSEEDRARMLDLFDPNLKQYTQTWEEDVPYVEMVPVTDTTVTQQMVDNPAYAAWQQGNRGGLTGYGGGWNNTIGGKYGQREPAPPKQIMQTTKSTDTKYNPVTKTKKETKSKVIDTLNPEWDKLRTLEMTKLSDKASNAAGDQAASRVDAAANSAYNQQARELMRRGGDPNRLANAAAQLASQQTLAKVGAANEARDKVRSQQTGLVAGAAGFGRNMPNTAAQAYGLADTLGNSGVGAAGAAANAQLPFGQLMNQGYQGQIGAAGQAMQGNLGLGNLMNSNYNSRLNAWQASQNNDSGLFGGLGSLMGGAAALYTAV